ncbi:BTAD domain-containing putative transcriptional regulator [Ensifer sp. P24N7]|uniref:BTAD domain-containing putative transcriptional regulator n=1 Tax=Sinorhizobium sp. P24N7 TaxID=3348358 RepID=UPI0035F3F73F
MFAYLAFNPGRSHGRTQLYGLFWGECGEQQARGSLRYALTDIRKGLGQYRTELSTERDRICLKPENVTVDASEFEHLARSHVPSELRRAAVLYRGDLLADVEIRAPAFNEWLEEERERLRALLAQALGRLLEMGPDYDLAQRLLALDPFSEVAHRALMRHYAAQKQWTLAIRQFDACATILKRELGVTPEPATCRLRETILNHRPVSDLAISSPAAGTASNCGPPAVEVSTFACIDALPEMAALASGLREAISTELARFRDVIVFRGGKADDAQFGLEGTLQRLGSRLRLTVMLIERETSQQIWAERYDRAADDPFTFQDELAATIATTAVASLTRLVHERAQHRAASDLRAYECFVRGNRYVDQVDDPEAQAQAQYWFERALEIDPTLARAHNGLAFASVRAFLADVGVQSSAKLDQALRHAETAIELDPTDPRAHYALAYVSLQRREFSRAQRHFLQALQINPNDPTILTGWSYAQACLGDADSGLKTLDLALRLMAAPPEWCFIYRSRILLLARRPSESVTQLSKLARADGPRDLAWHAIACAHAGRHTDASLLAAAFIDAMRASWRGDIHAGEREFASWFVDSALLARTEDREYLRHGLNLAGLHVQ